MELKDDLLQLKDDLLQLKDDLLELKDDLLELKDDLSQKKDDLLIHSDVLTRIKIWYNWRPIKTLVGPFILLYALLVGRVSCIDWAHVFCGTSHYPREGWSQLPKFAFKNISFFKLHEKKIGEISCCYCFKMLQLELQLSQNWRWPRPRKLSFSYFDNNNSIQIQHVQGKTEWGHFVLINKRKEGTTTTIPLFFVLHCTIFTENNLSN